MITDTQNVENASHIDVNQESRQAEGVYGRNSLYIVSGNGNLTKPKKNFQILTPSNLTLEYKSVIR